MPSIKDWRGLIESGELRRLYEKYGIWTDAQSELATMAGPLETVSGRRTARRMGAVTPVPVAAFRRGFCDDCAIG